MCAVWRVDEQQVPKQSGIGPVGLGPPLRTASCSGLGRFGQMGFHLRRLELLDDEAPPGGALHREGGLLAAELAQPTPKLLSHGGADHPQVSSPVRRST